MITMGRPPLYRARHSIVKMLVDKGPLAEMLDGIVDKIGQASLKDMTYLSSYLSATYILYYYYAGAVEVTIDWSGIGYKPVLKKFKPIYFAEAMVTAHILLNGGNIEQFTAITTAAVIADLATKEDEVSLPSEPPPPPPGEGFGGGGSGVRPQDRPDQWWLPNQGWGGGGGSTR